MEAWASEFISVWEQNRERLAEVGLHHIKNNPLLTLKEYTLTDSTQFLDGATAMMKEELTGSGTDVRDMYLNTVIPGILATGQPAFEFVAQCTVVAVVFSAIVLPQLQEGHRDQAAQFIAYFFASFNYEIVKAGMAMDVKA